ncbi:methyltransferase [Kerstersia gyiorum]|nr:methyltransferase [Kerstersia gyiorum]
MTSHPLQPYWNLTAAPIQSQALEQALAYGLFAQLQQSATADQVAERLGLNAEATAVWLDLLWSMELLVRRVPVQEAATAQYSTSALAAKYFLAASSENCTEAWLYRARFLTRFASQWGTLLREGFDPAGASREAAPKGSWAQAAREQIAQEQRAVTVPAVMRLLDTLPPLPQHGRFLDVGGGPGLVGIALAQRLPDWHGRVCDQAETADVAQENILQAGLAHRMDAVGCDLNHEAIDGRYDLIWCSAVLHFLQHPQEAVTKMVKAINPGGTLLLAHAEVSDEATLAARVLPFYGTVALRKNYLPQPGDMPRIMREAGLTEIDALGRVEFPMAPVWIYSGRRA